MSHLPAALLLAAVQITVDHNSGPAATAAFKFARVASPARDDAASTATVGLIAGKIDRNGGELRALIDGKLPSVEDEPGANLFFAPDTWGGRIRFDFGAPIDVGEIRTYSWHPDTRAPQLYHLYGSDGADPKFDAAPVSTVDPRTCGWKLLASVDTRPNEGERGGQYGVSITDSSGSLGRYRYLLFDIFETESEDSWGQTFYSEVDVVARK
jgi:hypothetical protein